MGCGNHCKALRFGRLESFKPLIAIKSLRKNREKSVINRFMKIKLRFFCKNCNFFAKIEIFHKNRNFFTKIASFLQKSQLNRFKKIAKKM